MDEQEEKPKVATSCEKCIFARWHEGTQTQIGCKVERLQKFKQQGHPLKMLETDGKTHYVIEDRICLMCCPQSTVDALHMKNPTIDMRKAIQLKCEAYVIATDENTLEQVKSTIDSLSMQELRLKKINVVLNTSKVSRASVVRYFNTLQQAYEEKGFEYAWNVTYISDVGEDGSRSSVEWCLDHAVATCGTPFYCVFMAGDIAPVNYLSSIDRALNDDLERFCLLLPADDYWKGAFVQAMLHKKLNGNIPETLEYYDDGELVATCLFDKIEYIAEKTEQPHMFKKVTDICPALK